MITEFVGLCSKNYSFKLLHGPDEKKCKGLMKSEMKKLEHSQIVECMTLGKKIDVNQRTFVSKKHTIYTISTNKTVSCEDSKRVNDPILGNEYTVPHGYNKLNNNI